MSHLLTADLSRLTPALREILRRHGVTRAAFFGSVARRQKTEDSDVDLLVEVEGVTYQSLDPRIRQQALDDQAPIL
jgi:predicted nucleotidyltransferase